MNFARQKPKKRLSLRAVMIALPLVIVRTSLAQFTGEPFDDVSVQYLGVTIGPNFERGYPTASPPLYDYQPSIMYEPEDPARKFKMWWLGQYKPGDIDPPPSNLDADDRIYYSYSPDGLAWSNPVVALKGQGGTGGYDAADDHLIGSPSVIRLNGTYYMFYEAYGSWTTVINRFFSFERGDTWCSNGQVQDAYSPGYPCDGASTPPDLHASYALEKTLGFAQALRKHGTHPVYSGEVTYLTINGGKINRYLQTTPPRNECNATEKWRPLNRGLPVFWLYNNNGQGRKAIYECFDLTHSNSYASDQADCEGHGLLVELLGYAAATLNTPFMVGSNQNRICLATSTDGVHWTRFEGAARGGAMLAPQNEQTNRYPHECGDVNANESYDMHRAYGSGYPCAIVRGSSLELHFSDDSLVNMNVCVRPVPSWRIRIPLSEIENPDAYIEATRQPNAIYMADMKWSPLFKRYFCVGRKTEAGYEPCDPSRVSSPNLFWSNFNPNPVNPPVFHDQRSFQEYFPTNASGGNFGRVASWGGLLGNALGHTVEFNNPGTTPDYLAAHIFYGAQRTFGATPAEAVCDTPFEWDLDHALVFLWPKDEDNDGTADWNDNCPTVPNVQQQDVDGDNVGNACDNCPEVPNSGQSNSDGDEYGNVCDEVGDANHDGNIGLDDYALFVPCFLDATPSNACLDSFDAPSQDSDVDLADFSIFQQSLSE